MLMYHDLARNLVSTHVFWGGTTLIDGWAAAAALGFLFVLLWRSKLPRGAAAKLRSPRGSVRQTSTRRPNFVGENPTIESNGDRRGIPRQSIDEGEARARLAPTLPNRDRPWPT